jgi:hypothetical protein
MSILMEFGYSCCILDIAFINIKISLMKKSKKKSAKKTNTKKAKKKAAPAKKKSAKKATPVKAKKKSAKKAAPAKAKKKVVKKSKPVAKKKQVKKVAAVSKPKPKAVAKKSKPVVKKVAQVKPQAKQPETIFIHKEIEVETALNPNGPFVELEEDTIEMDELPELEAETEGGMEDSADDFLTESDSNSVDGQ